MTESTLVGLHFDLDEYINPFLRSPPWQRLPHPVAHFLGYRKGPPRPLGNILMTFWSFLGVFISISIITAVGQHIHPLSDGGSVRIVGSFVSFLLPSGHSHLYAVEFGLTSFV